MAGSNTAAPNTAGTNKIHHQSGVVPSANAESLSVSQPRLRLFSTIGARCNFTGGANVFKLVAVSAINSLLSNQRIPHARSSHSSLGPGSAGVPPAQTKFAGETPALPVTSSELRNVKEVKNRIHFRSARSFLFGLEFAAAFFVFLKAVRPF